VPRKEFCFFFLSSVNLYYLLRGLGFFSIVDEVEMVCFRNIDVFQKLQRAYNVHE
jgi:hypothetical protein